MRSVAGLCAVAAAFGVIGTVNAQTKRAAQTLRFHSSSPIPKPSSALGGDVDIQRRLCVNPSTKLLPIRGASSGH
jgi:hypothetical protein